MSNLVLSRHCARVLLYPFPRPVINTPPKKSSGYLAELNGAALQHMYPFPANFLVLIIIFKYPNNP